MPRALLALFVATSALGMDDMVSTRALGMGEALRAGGSGAAAVYLNPAALPNAKQYVVEAEYQTRWVDSTHMIGVSIVDTVTAALAAGVYYTFATTSPEFAGNSVDVTTHEVGLALAYPFGGLFSFGATPKYFNTNGTAADPDDEVSHFTFDIGAVLHPFGALSFAAVGANLLNEPPTVRRQLGLGASWGMTDFLLLEFDARLDFDRREDVSPRYGGGGELFLADLFALRGGMVHESKEDATFATFGIGFVSPAVAVEFGMRQQIAAGDETLLSFALRVFAD